MPVGMLMQIPEGTQEFYDGVMEALEWESKPQPEGILAHYAGPGENGWTIFDVWESKEAFGRFAEERLMEAVQKVMPDAPKMEPQFIPIHYQLRTPAHA